MNKFILFFLISVTFVLGQNKLETTIIDFDKTGKSYPNKITKTTNNSYILANITDSIPSIIKFDSTNSNLDLLYNNSAYISYRTNHLYPLKDKIIFQNYHYPHSLTSFNGIEFKTLLNFPSRNLNNFIMNENGYFILSNDSYNQNRFYFTDGEKAQELAFKEYNATNFQLHYASINDLIYSFKQNDTITLSTYDIKSKLSKIISKQFVRNSTYKSIENFNKKFLFTINENDSNFIYQQINSDSLSKLSLLIHKNDTIFDTIPIKIESEFVSFKVDDNLFFSGNIKNDPTKLFQLSSENKLSIFSELKINNLNYSINNKSKYFIDGSKIYFTAYKNINDNLGSLWMLDNNLATVKLVKSEFNLPIENIFVLSNKIYFQDKKGIYKLNYNDSNVTKLTNDFTDITYSHLINKTIYFSATEAIHGNELYTLDTSNNKINLFKEFNYQNNTNVGQLLQSKDGVYFISNNKLYLFDGKSFESVSESSPFLVTSVYNRQPENFRTVIEFDNKILFINIESKLISYDKKSKIITDLGNTNYYGYGLEFNKKLVLVNNKVFFTGFDSTNKPNLYISDGTKNGTFILENLNLDIYSSENPNFIIYEKSSDKIYFIAKNNNGEVSLYSTKGEKNDFIKEYNFNSFLLENYKIIGTFQDNLVINEYNPNQGHKLYLLNNKQIKFNIPITFGNHYISGFQSDEHKMYFLYNNRFAESDGTIAGTKEIFQSNYERLFNLNRCGNSFYFEDENKRQIFKTTDYKTLLVKKFDEGHSITSNLCYNNTMFYVNSDSYDPKTYLARKNYIVISNDSDFKDLEIDHILKHQFGYSTTKISELAIYNDKLLLKYSNDVINDKSLFLSDITSSLLNTKEITASILFNSLTEVYPNPAKDQINIKIKDNSSILSVNIYNNLGQKVLMITYPKKNIDISDLEKGIYYIKIKTDSTVETKKIIKI